MAKGRKQVEDLQTVPLQSPNIGNDIGYAHPAQAPIDQSWALLEQGLGHFSASMTKLAHSTKEDDRVKRLAELEQWRQARTDDTALKLIREGKTGYESDKIVAGAYGKMWGGLEGQNLGKRIDKAITEGTIQGYGTDRFDPDAVVTEMAKEHLARVASNPHATIALGDQIDVARKALRAGHEKALSQLQTDRMSNAAYEQTWLAVKDAVAQNARVEAGTSHEADHIGYVSGQDIMDTLRRDGGVYHSFGPRKRGGAFDMRTKEIDQIVLKVADEMAQHPETAVLATQLLTANRTFEDGTNLPLSATAAHGPRIAEITRTASATLTKSYQADYTKAATEGGKRAFLMRDGSFAGYQPAPIQNPLDSSKPFHIEKEKLNKQVASEVATAMDEQYRSLIQSGQADKAREVLDATISTFSGNNVAHPIHIPLLKSVVAGVGIEDIKSGAVPNDKVAALEETVPLFERYRQLNEHYLREHMGEDNFRAMEAYIYGKREKGLSPAAAARGVALGKQAFSEANIGHLERKAETALSNNLDFSYGYSTYAYFKSWLPFTGGVFNGKEVSNEAAKEAAYLMAYNDITADEAIKVAVKNVRDRTVGINGRAVIDNRLTPGVEATGHNDEDAIHVLLKGAWDTHKVAIQNQFPHIKSADDLSIRKHADGVYEIIPAKVDGGLVLTGLQSEKGFTLKMTFQQIQQKRAELWKGITQSQQKQAEDALLHGKHQWWDQVPMMSPAVKAAYRRQATRSEALANLAKFQEQEAATQAARKKAQEYESPYAMRARKALHRND